jgi:hypothetical protein
MERSGRDRAHRHIYPPLTHRTGESNEDVSCFHTQIHQHSVRYGNRGIPPKLSSLPSPEKMYRHDVYCLMYLQRSHIGVLARISRRVVRLEGMNHIVQCVQIPSATVNLTSVCSVYRDTPQLFARLRDPDFLRGR